MKLNKSIFVLLIIVLCSLLLLRTYDGEIGMTKKIIFTENAPKAIGPYSQAVQAGGFIYIFLAKSLLTQSLVVLLMIPLNLKPIK